MPWIRTIFRFGFAVALLLSSGGLVYSVPSPAQNQRHAAELKPDLAAGQGIFNSNCAGCHGLDGRGGDKGIEIGGESGRRLSDAKLLSVISKGIAGTSMPPFPELSESKIRNVIGFLRLLQGKQEDRTVPGDPARGKDLFFGKAGCSRCHSISGAGGFLGPDLSSYGFTASAKSIRDEITRSNRVESSGYRSAVLTLQDGTKLKGLLRNEDNFSLQLLTKDGGFHFYLKSDLSNVEYPGRSFMPSDYANWLSASELDDLASYIIKSASRINTPTSKDGEFSE